MGTNRQNSLLTALTQEIYHPGQGYLDEYLKPFVRSAINRQQSTSILMSLKGLTPQQILKINLVLDRSWDRFLPYILDFSYIILEKLIDATILYLCASRNVSELLILVILR